MLAINNSLPCCKSELDLFATFPSNTSILNSEIKTIVADNNVKDQSVIQFTIKPTPDYINLSETKLYFIILAGGIWHLACGSDMCHVACALWHMAFGSGIHLSYFLQW